MAKRLKVSNLFTININSTGYSDQLNQFMLAYEFGVRLGLAYVYTEIENTPQHFGDRSRNFLDAAFSDTTLNVECQNMPRIDFELSSKEMIDMGIQSGQAALDFLKNKLNSLDTSSGLLELKLIDDRNYLLTLLEDFDDDILAPIRARMNTQLDTYSVDSLYPFDAEIKVFIHLRYGDVALLPTPWTLDFNLWSSQCFGALETTTPESMRLLRVAIRELNETYGEKRICFSIHSDNFDLSERDCTKLMTDNPLVTPEQLRLCRHTLKEMSSELALFRQFDNAKVFIDADPAGVEKLTSALLNSDIAISNGLQRMTSKLLSVFSTGKPLAFAALMEDNRDKPFHTLVLPPQEIVEFIPLEYKSFSLEPIKHFINEKIINSKDSWSFPDFVSNKARRSSYCITDLANMGYELQQVGQYEDALLCYNRALEFSNNNDSLTLNKLNILAELGRTKEHDDLAKILTEKNEATDHARHNYQSIKLKMGVRDRSKTINTNFSKKLIHRIKSLIIAPLSSR